MKKYISGKTFKLSLVLAGVVVCINSATAAVLTGPIVNPANNDAYYLPDFTSWSQFEVEAITLGGNLEAVDNQAEHHWVFHAFGTFGDVSRAHRKGHGDTSSESHFVWSSGHADNGISGSEIENQAHLLRSMHPDAGHRTHFRHSFVPGHHRNSNVVAPSVPVPAAVWLFGSGLLGLAGVARRKLHF